MVDADRAHRHPVHPKGIEKVRLTLHVGLGTFAPITADELAGHKMHAEWYELPQATVDAVAAMTRDWDKDQCFTGAMNFACTCDNPEIQDPIQEHLTAAQNALTMEERTKAFLSTIPSDGSVPRSGRSSSKARV